MHRKSYLFSVALLTFAFATSVSPAQSVKSIDNKDNAKLAPTTVVVVEGVGLTEDQALKNAFRNAVRQVVGAVVDTETMIKNDAIIDDSILTYSAGLVKKYDEVPGSKSSKDGSHSIRIKAVVERGDVVRKLQAANVSIMSVDGKGLFAEITSQLQSEGDALGIIEKQLEGFPESCVKISIVGKPTTTEKTETTATLNFLVRVEPDLVAYEAFQSRLLGILSKIAKGKGDTTVKFQKAPSRPSWQSDRSILATSGAVQELPIFAPRAFSPKNSASDFVWKVDVFTISVLTSITKSGDRADYRYFHFDLPLRNAVCKAVGKKSTAKLQLLDSLGRVIATDRFAPNEGQFLGTLISLYGAGEHDRTVRRFDGEPQQGNLCIIGPTFDYIDHYQWLHGHMAQKRSLLFDVPIKLTHDELRSVQDAKVEITYE